MCRKTTTAKLGTIGVVNRSEEDIVHNKVGVKRILSCILQNINVQYITNKIIFSLQRQSDALQDEAAYLEDKFPNQGNRNGTAFLCKTLNRILLSHVHQSIPSIEVRTFIFDSSVEHY